MISIGVIIFGIFFGQVVVKGYNVTEEEYATMPILFPTDDYDKCMMYGKRALFCYAHFQLEPLSKEHPSNVWKAIEAVSSSPTHYRHDLIRHFMCIPDACPDISITDPKDVRLRAELDRCLDRKYAPMGLRGTAEIIKCKSAKPPYDFQSLDYVVLFLFITYIACVFLISFYDLKKSYDSPNEYKNWRESPVGSIAIAFSIPGNWAKLKSENRSPDGEKLRAVQGVRVFMTFLVVLVHTVTAYAAIPLSNPHFIEEVNDTKPLLGEFAKRGIFLLSFYFMMSMWVLINSLLAKSDKNETIDIGFIVNSVIKRYIRFLPTVLVVVGFSATWLRHIPFGPYWYGVCDESERCRKNWWTNLLFIQNYVDRYYMCYIISWYLGVEMQYYIISLLLIMLLHKRRHLIPLVVGVLFPINFAFAFWDHYRHRYPSRLSSNPEDIYGLKFNREPQWHDHFASYHANFAGSLVGMVFGYLYYTHKNDKLFQSQISRILWWIFSFGSVAATVLVPQLFDVDQTPALAAVWVAMTRPLFAFGMGLMIFGMTQGLGGAIKWFFEWSPLYVLAKLSYCVYIGHALFQNIRVGMLRSPPHLDYYSFMNTVLADIAIAFIAALFLTLFFEMPANDLANMLYRTKKVPDDKKKK